MALTTPRSIVALRRPARGDRDEVIDLVRRSRRFHARWVAPPSDARAYAAYLARARDPAFACFLVCRREDAAIVGAVNLNQIVRGLFHSAYLGYWAGAPFAGKGYMRAGLALVLKEAFGPLRLHRLEANIQPENAASRALVVGLGFQLEGYSPRYLKIGGRWRDHERWAILRDAWRAAPRPHAPAAPVGRRRSTSAAVGCTHSRPGGGILQHSCVGLRVADVA